MTRRLNFESGSERESNGGRAADAAPIGLDTLATSTAKANGWIVAGGRSPCGRAERTPAVHAQLGALP